MRRFSDLNIKSDKKIFNCKQVSINDILNIEIVVIDAIMQKTKNGDKALIHFKLDNECGKFFTGSMGIIDVIQQLKASDFPFTTIVKSTQYGKGKIYQFT